MPRKFRLEEKLCKDLEPGDVYLSKVYGGGIVATEVVAIDHPKSYGTVYFKARRDKVESPGFDYFYVEASGKVTVVKTWIENENV